jgi:hypothetical protein
VSGARGEVTFSAGDREVRVLFTNRTIAAAEQKLGKSILAVARGLTDGTTGLGETVVLLREGMEAARRDANERGPAVALETAYNVMDIAGFATIAGAVMEGVSAVLNWGLAGDEVDDEGDDPNP